MNNFILYKILQKQQVLFVEKGRNINKVRKQLATLYLDYFNFFYFKQNKSACNVMVHYSMK